MKHNLVICSFILSLILLPGLTGNLQAQKDKKPPAKKQITTVRLVAIYDLLNDTGKEIHENTSQRLSRELHHNFQLIKSINAVDPHRIMTKTRVPKKIDKKKSTGFPAIDYKMDSISAHFLLTSGKELSEADKSGVVAASGNAHLIIYGMIKLLDNGKLEFRVQNIGPLQPEGGKPLIIKESSDRVHVVADKITLWAMSSLAIPDPDKELLEKIEFGKNTNYAAQTTWREMEYYLKHNDIDNAILKCKHILSLDPNYYPAYEKLGMIYEKQKAYKLALYYYQLFLSKTNSKDQKSELNSKYLALSRQFSLSDDFSVHLPGQNTDLMDDKKPADSEMSAQTSFQLGQSLLKQSKYQQAKKYLLKAKALSIETKSQIVLARSLEALGTISLGSKDFTGAQSSFEQAVDIYESMNDRLRATRLYNNLGYISAKHGNLKKSMAYFTMSLDFWTKHNHKRGLIQTHLTMGKSFVSLGNYKMAQLSYQKAFKHSKELGDLTGQGLALDLISGLTTDEDNSQSDQQYLQYLPLVEKFNRQKKQSALFYHIGLYYLANDNHAKAVGYMEKVIDMNKKLGHKAVIETIYNNMGLLYLTNKNYKKALLYLKKALAISKRTQNKITLSSRYNNIASVHFRVKNYKDALEMFKQSLELKNTIRDTLGIANTHYNLALLLKEMSNKAEALSHIKKAIAIEKKYGSPNYKASLRLLKRLK